MGSTLVRLQAGDPPAHTLSLVAGVAVIQALKASAPGVAGLVLKWPNDVLIEGAKLAGILLERTGNAVVVGIGVNLAQAPDVPGRATASLAAWDCVVGRDTFAAILDTCWSEALRLWRCGGWEQVRRDWNTQAHPVGTPLTVHGGDGEEVHGTFAGIDSNGALQLQLAGGTRRTIHAGEVLLDRR